MQTKIIRFSVILILVLTACQAASESPQTTLASIAVISNSTTPAARSTVIPDTTATTSETIVFPKIDRHPTAADYLRGKMTTLPTYDLNSDEMWQMDLRSYDLATLDFRNSLDHLLFASFDDQTIWPAADRMPPGFNPQQIMNLGKNPGLGVRSLHQEGITGEGVGVAIIDQTLLVDHKEYVDRTRLYEETEDIQGGWLEPTMHGAGVSSIAVGKTVGVAPGSDLYYIATAMCNNTGTFEGNDFSCLAKAVRRIIEINSQLPSGRKIRVLSMSTGWRPESKGFAEIESAVQEARDSGIFIICSSEKELYGLDFHGLGRLPLANPDSFKSYEPGLWWAENFFQGLDVLQSTLLIPMDSRATASPTGTDEYVFYREGGWSWSIPYIAGVYALAAQVKADITPEVFWSTALETGKTIEITHESTIFSFGVILDPVALIHALQEL
jgi:subtilisin family serine protease